MPAQVAVDRPAPQLGEAQTAASGAPVGATLGQRFAPSAVANDDADAAAGGWVDAPPSCVSSCPSLVYCCGRHPAQKAAFAAAQRSAAATRVARQQAAADKAAHRGLWGVSAMHGLDSDIESCLDMLAAALWALVTVLALRLCNCCGGREERKGAQASWGLRGGRLRQATRALTPAEEASLTARRCPGCPCTVQVGWDDAWRGP